MKNRFTALILVAVVIIGAVLFGTHRSVNAQRKAVAEYFYDGTDSSGYGISTNLNLRIEYARNLCKVAADYDVDEAADAVAAACSALEDCSDAAEKYSCNNDLTDAVDTLERELNKQSLSSEDADLVSELTADIASYEMRIDKLASSYNAEVRSYNEDVASAFPGGYLARLTGVGKLEEYA